MSDEKKAAVPGAELMADCLKFWGECLSRAWSPPEPPGRSLAEFMKGFLGSGFELFPKTQPPDPGDRMAAALRFYSSMLNWWTGLFIQHFSGQLSRQFSGSGTPADGEGAAFPPPDEILKTMETYVRSFSKWADMFTKFVREGADPSDQARDRITRHIDSLLKIYEDGPGRFIRMPSVGPSRNFLEREKSWIDAAIKYQMILLEYYQNLLHPIIEVSAVIVERARTMMDQGATEEMMRELYTLLITEGEKAYARHFQSEAYLQSMKMTLDAHLDMQETCNAMVIEMLKGTPVVTKPDIEDVYRDLYLLKKKVREMEKKLSRLEGEEDR